MKKALAMMTGALCLFMASCSSDEPGPNPNPDPQGDVYARLTLQLPQTRSNTTDDGQSTNGNETGKDYENNIKSIRIVLAEKVSDNSYKFIAAGATESALLDQSQKNTYSITFQSEQLEEWSGKSETPGEGTGDSKPVYVFAYCNPTSKVNDFITSLTVGQDFTGEQATLVSEAEANNLPWAQKNEFMMTNHSLTSVDLPNYQTLIRQHNTKATAFNLGTVSVERVVSRFDFMPTNNNQYTINDNVSGLPAAIVEINGMSLINEAKSFYLLPRVSDVENWSNPVICGKENVNNWVVTPNYDAKAAFALPNAPYTGEGGIAANYFFPNPAPNTLTYGMPGTESDNNDWEDYEEGYKIWRYATENTMPTNAMKQGITTGIVFRAEIKAAPANTSVPEGQIDPAKVISDAINAKANIYAWTSDAKNPENNIMLGTAKDVWAYCYTHASSTVRTNFLAAVAAGDFTVQRTVGGNTTSCTTEDEIFPALGPGESLSGTLAPQFTVSGFGANGAYGELKNNFMVYAPTDGKYYVYYRYYNRHNNNDMPDLMGPMEFATVRNNIYKLKVSKISAFGLPGDIVTPPNTDDETPEVYFKVAVKVLKWVVRVNNIEF